MSVFGTEKTIPLAKVKLTCDLGEKEVTVGVVPNLPINMILGNEEMT
jgi:hypothetical protein